MTVQNIVTFLSPIISIVAAVVAGFYSLRTRQNDYRNDYYKIVVAKRLSAYEAVENLIKTLKTAAVDPTDGRTYHFLLASGGNLAHDLIAEITGQSLWLSDACFAKSQELNRKLYRLDGGDLAKAIEFSKVNYEAIAQIRSELEDILAADMAILHDVKRFFRRKKKAAKSGFQTHEL